MAVNAICRKCGKSALADDFKLHYEYRMMVCPNCFSGRTDKKLEEKKVFITEKPAGWDIEDEYLEKAARLKKKEKPAFKKIPGSSHLECTCKSCMFSFKYDPFRKRPRTCPYCNEEIPKLNTFSML